MEHCDICGTDTEGGHADTDECIESLNNFCMAIHHENQELERELAAAQAERHTVTCVLLESQVAHMQEQLTIAGTHQRNLQDVLKKTQQERDAAEQRGLLRAAAHLEAQRDHYPEPTIKGALQYQANQLREMADRKNKD